MPSMDPLVRQQGLLFEQSELLREQFLRFGEGMQRLHGMVERLREDLEVEKQQRLHGEDQASSSLAGLRMDFNNERRRQDVVLKQADERLIAAREEMILRARGCDSEMQRLGGRLDSLVADISPQIAGLHEKQRASGEDLQSEFRSRLSEEHAWCEASLKSLRKELLENLAGKSQLQDELQLRDKGFVRLDARIDEECLRNLREESDLWQTSFAACRKECEDLQQTVGQSLESVSIRIDAVSRDGVIAVEALDRRVTEKLESCFSMLGGEERGRLEAQEAFQESLKHLSGKLSMAETDISRRIVDMENESACEAQLHAARLTALSGAHEELGAELGMERQQRSVNTLGLLSEVNEVRSEVSREIESRHEVAAQLDQYSQQTDSLQRLAQEAKSTREALSLQSSELRERTGELQLSVETALSDITQLRSVADGAKLGQEELWHVIGSLQEHNALANAQLQELDIRSEHIEVDRLGAVSCKLEEFATMSDDLTARFDTFEQCSLKEQVAITSRLDTCFYDLVQTRSSVDALLEDTNQDFLQSQNARFRLYLTPEGDVAVFQRNNWGKWSDSDFQGIPCWHAGSQVVGDKPLCSVNREMQAHEKDRFLALANRNYASMSQ